jgi:two-component system, OmpR family, sensor histidine kinase CreC
MRISLRILLGYFLIVGLAAYFVLSVFQQEVKPGVRQALEDSLVDAANLLAELAAPELAAGRLADGDFARAVAAYRQRQVDATIWERRKRSLDYRVYVTDDRGRVVFDSAGEAVGQDYSRWNDVYLTLQGRYGVRTSPVSPADPDNTVMHVAAPVRDPDGRIIGALTVARPNLTVAPIVERSERRIRLAGYLLLGLSALIGAYFTWRLTRSINRLRTYAREVAEGRKTRPPPSASPEIAELGRALEAMREKLDGKQYVEDYVHSLTHELKSPLAAIRGAAELLEEDLPAVQRSRFLANILGQCERLQGIAERMLALATLEHRQQLQAPQILDLAPLLEGVVEAAHPRLAARGLAVDSRFDLAARVRCEVFLLQGALANLLDNAIDFAPAGSRLELLLTADAQSATVTLRDHGPGIPDYALPRVFERFYSLPRPDGRPKSTGLGLAFVAEVVKLHRGEVTLRNHPEGGVEVTVRLPLAG